MRLFHVEIVFHGSGGDVDGEAGGGCPNLTLVRAAGVEPERSLVEAGLAKGLSEKAVERCCGQSEALFRK
jgi:hypothetical protein